MKQILKAIAIVVSVLFVPMVHLAVLLEGSSDGGWLALQVVFYDTIDFLLCGIVILLWTGWWKNIIHKIPLDRQWSKRMSVISGLLSLISLLGFNAIYLGSQNMPGMFRQPLSELAFLAIPGLDLAILAVITGVMAYKREKSRIGLLGLAFGAVAIIVIITNASAPNGTVLFCRSDMACNNDNPYHSVNGWACSLHNAPAKVAGICLPPEPTLPI